ncbi:MAG: carboxypeptidase regulatory-like domain-containing protein [Terriglobia bacterium]
MRKNALFAAGVALWLVWGALPALAQFGQMQGTVKNEDGNPAAEVIVSVDRQDIRGHYEVKTDRNGRFFHAGLPLGTYSVSVKQRNGQPFALNGIVVRLSAPASVDIDLQQEFMRAQAAAQGIQVEGNANLSQEQMAAIQQAAKEREEAIAKRQELTGKFQSGLEAMKAKNYDQAIADFEAAAVVDPTQHVIFAQMGEAYKEKAVAARGDERRQFYEKSMESYQKALAMKADDASYHNNFALALANAGKVEEAQAELVKAAELDPMNAARYYFNLGAVLVNRGDSNAAAEAFLKATQADPNLADGFFQLGIALMGKATMDPSGKMLPAPGTLEAFQKYLALAPTGPNASAAKDALTALGGTVPTQVRR